MRILVIGAGGHGRVAAECAQNIGLMVIGFIDKDPHKHGQKLHDIPIYSFDDDVVKKCDGVVLGIGEPTNRMNSLNWAVDANLHLPVLTHPTAWVSKYAHCGIGTIIMAGAIVQTDCQIGRGVIINTSASVDHDNILDDGVHIAPGAHLAGNVHIGANTHVGLGSSIIEGIRIGKNCLIAAGAVVINDIEDGQQVAGIPARVMKNN